MQAQGNKKWCTACQTWQTLDAFSKAKRQKDGLCCFCRECMKLYARASRQKRLEHYRTTNLTWNKQHPDSVRESSRQSYKKLSKVHRFTGLSIAQVRALPPDVRQQLLARAEAVEAA